MFRSTMILLMLALLMVSASICPAAVPSLMSYQGKLANDSGVAVPDGTYNMRFYLYSTESGGSPVWVEPAVRDSARSVQVTGGLFNVLLGSIVALPDSAFEGDLWMQTEVNGTLLVPRTRIVSAAYALRAKNVDDIPVNSVTSAKILDGEVRTADIANSTVTGDKISIPLNLSGGVASPETVLNVMNSGSGYAIRGTNSGSGGAGLFEVTQISDSAPALQATTVGNGAAISATAGTGYAGDFAGKIKMTGFQLQNADAASGKILRCLDSGGTATWDADGISAPYMVSISSVQDALTVINSGAGGAITCQNNGGSDCLDISVNGGTRHAANLYLTGGSGDVVQANQYGTGHAGYFQINNASSTSEALHVYNTGTGDGILVSCTNAADAIQAANYGGGWAGNFIGNVKVSGQMYVSSGNLVVEGRAKLPIAYGYVDASGNYWGTSNFSVVWNSTFKYYEFTLSEGSAIMGTHFITVTPYTPSALFAVSYVSSGKIRVVIYNTDGTAVQNAFQFQIHRM